MNLIMFFAGMSIGVIITTAIFLYYFKRIEDAKLCEKFNSKPEEGYKVGEEHA